MEITIDPYSRCDLVKAVGRIDTRTSSDLEKTFQDILKSGKTGIVFDMRDISFISSRGLWVLIETQKQCKAKNGKLVLTNVTDDIMITFDLAGVKYFAEIFDDVIAAVGSF